MACLTQVLWGISRERWAWLRAVAVPWWFMVHKRLVMKNQDHYQWLVFVCHVGFAWLCLFAPAPRSFLCTILPMTSGTDTTTEPIGRFKRTAEIRNTYFFCLTQQWMCSRMHQKTHIFWSFFAPNQRFRMLQRRGGLAPADMARLSFHGRMVGSNCNWYPPRLLNASGFHVPMDCETMELCELGKFWNTSGTCFPTADLSLMIGPMARKPASQQWSASNKSGNELMFYRAKLQHLT